MEGLASSAKNTFTADDCQSTAISVSTRVPVGIEKGGEGDEVIERAGVDQDRRGAPPPGNAVAGPPRLITIITLARWMKSASSMSERQNASSARMHW
jgi:hypothetical protein